MKNGLFLFIILIIAVAFISCQKEQNPVGPSLISDHSEFSRANIPFGSTIDSAKFYINVTTATDEEVTLHRITADWEELAVTWTNFAGSFNTNTEGSFTPNATGWYEADVTQLVSNWLDDTYPNFGVLLKEESPAILQTYSSRETDVIPYLKIWWTLNGSNGFDSTTAMTDTYIRPDSSDVNFGSSAILITGWQDNAEVQTLVRFEIEISYTGCTHSKGYWKTHSNYGPAPYDTTWILIGEDSPFFLSNQSYYEVMWTPPRGGNAYYILAHQYIATELNFKGGADPGEIQDLFDECTDLFNTYTPADIGSLRGSDPVRQQFLELKNSLDQYNNGIIGPGQCDEISIDEAPYINDQIKNK